ncbi:MAG TPA: prolyl oligopeptidase family serine peptidase [Allosphingosinicella sp.]|jgi:dipeptidyl aminopeptidase/acylaminoacyl peptidase
MLRAIAAAFLLSLIPTQALGQARATPAPAPSDQVPLAVFGRLPQTERPRISTDGSAIAAKIRINGEQVLAVIPLDTPNPVPAVVARDGEFDQRDDRRAVNWEWVDPDHLLIWVVSRQNMDGEPVDEVRVISYNRRTRQVQRLGWDNAFINGGNVIWRSRSGPPRILISRNTSAAGNRERLGNQEVISVDVATGQHEVVIRPQRGIQRWFADGEGNVRLGLSSDGRTGRITAMYRPGGEGNFRTIYSETSQRYREPPLPIIFLPGDRALVQSRHEGFSAVYEMDLNTMQIGRKVFGVDGYDVQGVVPNLQANAMAGVTVIEDRERHVWMEPRLREIQTALDETWGAGNAEIASADHAREKLVIRVGAPHQAGGFYLYDTTTGDMRHIGWINNDLRDMGMNPVRTIRYRTTDGKTIAAVLTLPRRREHRNLPLIVLPHGGPWARDYESWDMWAQPLAEMGYAVVQPNFRGSSGFGYEWEAAADGNWGMRMQDDLLDAITHLSNEGIADKGRVCIFGWSYGGYAASRAAQRDGQHYRCAISGAGVHDIPAMVAFDRNYLGRYGSQYIGSAATRLADVSPSLHADQFSIPILIVHGARDQRVPVAQSRTLVSRLRAAGKVEGRDFVYLEQPRNTHNLPLEEDRVQLLEAVQRFLTQHNPA